MAFAHKWAVDVIFKLSVSSGSSKSDMASKLRFRSAQFIQSTLRFDQAGDA
jgi:hypothetical protein